MKLTNRFLSLLLAVAMVLSMVPAVSAATETILVGTTEEWNAQIDALQSATTAMTVSIKFTDDIVATKELKIPYGIKHNVTVDMDGHKLTSTEAIRAFNLHAGTLTVSNGTVEMPGINQPTAGDDTTSRDTKDCEFDGCGGILIVYKANLNLNNVTVKKVQTTNVVASGGVLYLRSLSTVKLNNSHLVVDQDDTYDALYGGLVTMTNYSGAPKLYLENSSVSGGYAKHYGGNFCMSGGAQVHIDKDSSVFNGKVSKDASHGGGNFYNGNENSRIYLNGGEIYGGIVESGCGGNLRINAGQLHMTGGKIYGGIARATSDATTKNTYGGNIHLNNAKAQLYMTGGEIYGGLAQSYTGWTSGGGNIYAISGSVTINGGGKIYDGTATGTNNVTGGNIYISSGTLTLNDGEIYDGVARGTGGSSKSVYGGNIYSTGATVNINGGKIYGGQAVSTVYSAHGGNLYMTNNNTTYPVTVMNGGEITGGHVEGVKEIYGAAVALHKGRFILNGGKIGAGTSKKLATTTNGGSTGLQTYSATVVNAAGDLDALHMYGGELAALSYNNAATVKLHTGKTGGNHSKCVAACSESTTTKVNGYYVITHKNTDGTENDVAATCTTAGKINVTCADCVLTVGSNTYGGTYTYAVPALGHTPKASVTENEVANSCTGEGSYDTVVYCEVCNAEISRETTTVPAAGHTPKTPVIENEVANSCTADGSFDTVIYCEVCSAEISRETTTVPAAGHTPKAPVIENEVANTCTDEGSYDTVVYCEVCNAEISRETTTFAATGHTPKAPVTENEVANTCTADGSFDTVVYCEICGAEISRETTTVPAAGHTPKAPVIENEVANTCAADGSFDTVVYCEICGAEISRETTTVPAAGHSYTGVKTEATYDADAFTTYTCGTCGDRYVETHEGTKLQRILPNAIVAEQEAMTLKAGEYNVWNGSLSEGTKNLPLEIVVNFKAEDTLEECLAGGYSDWLTDFNITFTGMSGNSIVADNCYLAGCYGEFGWITIPADGMVLENNVTYPVVAVAGIKLDYEGIVTGVKDFTAAIHIDQAILDANPNLEVKLELVMTNPENADDKVQVGEDIVYTAEQLTNTKVLPNAIVAEQEAMILKAGEYNVWNGSLSQGTKNLPLELVVNFKAEDTLEECLAGGYADWLVDFNLTLSDLSGNSIVADNCYLAGHYGSFGWIAIPTDGFVLENGETYPVVSGYDPTLNYKDICKSVQNFTAAIHIDQAILDANPNLEVKLELVMTNPNNAEDKIQIGEDLIYTFKDLTNIKLPEAEVTPMGKLTLEEDEYRVWNGMTRHPEITEDKALNPGEGQMPLEVLVNFRAKDTLEECMAGGFSKWLVDFNITIEGLENGSFVADDCYLAGNYGSFGWIKIPLDGQVIEEGVTYPVVALYDNTLNYKDICKSVKDFTAAIHIDPAILEANRDISVKLELVMTNPDNAEEKMQIGEDLIYRFDALYSGAVAQNVQTGLIYSTIKSGMDASQAGDTIILLADHQEADVSVKMNRTLDLNGHILTVETMNCTFVGAHIIDTTDGKGLLVVERDAIAVSANNVYLPVWCEGEGYRFVKIAFKQSLKLKDGDGYLRFYLEGDDAACTLQQALSDGGADNGVSVRVLVEWTDKNGSTGKKTYVYTDAKVKKYAANWTGNEFRLTVSGMENVSELKLTAMMFSEANENTNVSISGETKTLQNND